MSWFDKLFGEQQNDRPQPQQEDMPPREEDNHDEIYRRPKGKFRFPLDVDDSKQLQVQPSPEERPLRQSHFVNDEYFNNRRARRKSRTHDETTSVNRTTERYHPSYTPPPKSDIHKPKFVASEVPSAIYGSRKNLKPSEHQVVITPLSGRKPDDVKPETPTHRKQDNMVNVENIYASQIVAEIRREREKKAQSKKAFEEKRRQLKIQEEQTVSSQENEEETLYAGEVEELVIQDTASQLETVEVVLPPSHESRTVIIDEPTSVDTTDVVDTEPADNEAVDTIVPQPPAAATVVEAESHIDETVEEAVLESQETLTVKKTTPFNVVMTPSDKKRLMDKTMPAQPSDVEAPAEASAEQPTMIEKVIDFVTPDAKEDGEPTVIDKVKEAVMPNKDKKRKGPNYLLPTVSLLESPVQTEASLEWVEEQRQQLDEAFYHFNVPAKVESVVVGPSVTRYELSVEKGVKVSRITNLQDDIKMALAAKDIRIEAPIPGTSRVGVEVPNIETRKVNLSEVVSSKRFKFAESKLMVALGVKINNEPMLMDIAKMPHALIAGATGSGKSVSINTILLSLLYRNNPNELKLLLIDPKMVELAPYNDLPHLLAPVITDVKAATESLKWIVEEMERRYKTFADVHVRNITAYNQKSPYDKRLPKIVIIIDELADLMMMAPQEVEHSIARIAQKARAAGIHMILATQRPSVNVITGLIKANVPTRLAFMVSSAVDSRTVMDNGGAEKLLGNGDMLYQGNGMNRPIRIQGCYVSDEEIDEVVAYIKEQGAPNYIFKQEELLSKMNELPQDELFDEVIDYMQDEGHISTSQLQRRFQIGYNRAARIVDSLEEAGYISGANGSKPRTVLLTEKQQ